MELREKIAHLYRRFGLGASYEEVEAAVPLGLDGALDRLIENPKPYAFPPGPYEFVWYSHVDPDASAEYFRRWWLLRMLCTTDPLTERMTLFWHSHFAVSSDKVMFGPMMLDYLLALQRNACGSFRTLLGEAVTSPALLEYLDMSRSLKGTPNENLPRELMELYTLGVDRYAEEDVREVARALTGWGYVNVFFELPGTNRQRIEESNRLDRPFAAFAPMPAMHDAGEKTILGRKGKLTGEDVLDILASHPETAERLVTKLWSYFVYPEPEPAVLASAIAAWTAGDGDIRKTLGAIARTPEFFSERAVRQKVKSPVDYTVGLMRAAGVGAQTLSLRERPGSFDHPLPQLIHQVLYGFLSSMDRQGQALLRPNDASGWREGEVWVTSGAQGERLALRIPFNTPDKGNDAILKSIRDFVAAGKPAKTSEVLDRLCLLFDWSPSAESRVVLEGIWTGKPGGYLSDLWQFYPRLTQTLHAVAATPEVHFC
jgi:uncharacterized protein (DUF1800 family)